MGWVLRDLRSGWRALLKQPGSAVLSIVAFSLGIGLCTTMFSLVYGVFARGPDIVEPSRVVMIDRANPSKDQSGMGVPQSDFYDWVEQQTSFSHMAAYSTGTVNVTGTDGPERYDGGFVTHGTFDLLGVQPIIGRTFVDGDDDPGAAMTLLLGHQLWQDRFAGSPDVLGEIVKVNGEQATIIGVMPQGFEFPQAQELWVPARDRRAELENRADGTWSSVLGRLNPGTTREQAELEFATIGRRLAQDYPEENEGIGPQFTTIIENDTGPELRMIFGAMLIATIFVLLIACANVANLLLARAAMRTKEAAVRSSVGASRFQVVFPFFGEALTLSVIGAAIGIGIAFMGVGLFDAATQGVGKPYYMKFAVDLPILLFVLCVTLLTALVSGAAPAFQVSRANTNAVLKDESRGSSSFHAGRLSKALVIGQVALSCALLIGAGLMTKSMVNLTQYDYNFLTDEVFTARVGLFPTDYPDEASRQQFTEDLLAQLGTIPQAAAASLSSSLPGTGSGRQRIALEGEAYAEEEDMPRVHVATVTPDFFATVGVEVIEGRTFAAFDDEASEKVAVVNQDMAEQLFPGQSALGRRIRAGSSEDEADWRTVVGVAPSLRMEGFDSSPEANPAGYYVPLAQSDLQFMSIAVQARNGDGLGLTEAVRNAVRSVDSDLPIYNVFTLQAAIDQSGWFYSVFGTLFVVFGIAALFLASVGLYGVLSFSVSRREHEMGIRMALGAGARDVVRLVLRQGLVQLAFGLMIGLALAVGLSRVLGILMFEVDARDPTVFVGITGIILVVGLVASFVPARRATNVDPMEALRT